MDVKVFYYLFSPRQSQGSERQEESRGKRSCRKLPPWFDIFRVMVFFFSCDQMSTLDPKNSVWSIEVERPSSILSGQFKMSFLSGYNFKIGGTIATDFEPVKKEFEKYFQNGLESRGQLCVYVGEEKVVGRCPLFKFQDTTPSLCRPLWINIRQWRLWTVKSNSNLQCWQSKKPFSAYQSQWWRS